MLPDPSYLQLFVNLINAVKENYCVWLIISKNYLLSINYYRLLIVHSDILNTKAVYLKNNQHNRASCLPINRRTNCRRIEIGGKHELAQSICRRALRFLLTSLLQDGGVDTWHKTVIYWREVREPFRLNLVCRSCEVVTKYIYLLFIVHRTCKIVEVTSRFVIRKLCNLLCIFKYLYIY